MNILFIAISVLSVIVLTITNPNEILLALSSGATSAIKLTVSLIGVYAVWLGFIEIMKDTNLSNKLSNLLKPLIKKLFKTNNENAISQISLSLSANMLGIGGVATPAAIEGMKFLDDDNNENAKTMLFVISATSIQILPLSVIQLLTENGASNPFNVFFPTLITTVLSTALGIILVKVFK